MLPGHSFYSLLLGLRSPVWYTRVQQISSLPVVFAGLTHRYDILLSYSYIFCSFGVCMIQNVKSRDPTFSSLLGLVPKRHHRCLNTLSSLSNPLLRSLFILRWDTTHTTVATRRQVTNSFSIPAISSRSGKLSPSYTAALRRNALPAEFR